MKPGVLTFSLVAIGLASTAFAVSPKANLSAAKAQMRSEIRREGRAPALLSTRHGVSTTMSNVDSAPATAGGGGDTDTFGRNVIWDRLLSSGTISRQGLIQGYGLTNAQVDDFFKKPITLHLGVRGSASLIDFGYLIYGLRIMGD